MEALSFSQLVQGMNALSMTEQLELNKVLCDMIRAKRKVQAVVSGVKFFPTQVVKFNAKTRGMKFLKIEKFNRAGTAVVGYECDSTGKVIPATPRWTVSTNLCTAV